ncbi:OmpA family protein [Pararhizobium haloflavum]|uniref:OmpA family protein n=1 Tax=Pararhizobium haloflavum TaxID=2037914 RepID=UPI001300047D|nr:OmpA family protein [Pararhizobium haloflavum]
MSVMRKRLLATAAMPLLAAGLASGAAFAAPTSADRTPAGQASGTMLLAQGEAPAPAECPPGTVPSEGGCLGEAPAEEPAPAPAEEPAPEPQPAPEAAPEPAPEPAPAEPPVEEAPAQEAPPAAEPQPAPPPAAEEAPEPAPAPEAAPQAEEAPAEPAPQETAPAAEEAPAEAPPVEEAPAEEPVTEEAPAEEPAAEEAPAEEPAMEAPAAPAPEAPADAEPQDAPAAEEAPAEPDAPPAEEAPAPAGEEAPTDPVPVPEEAPAEQPAAEEAPSEEPAMEEAPTEAPAAEEAPVDQAPAEGEAPVDGQAPAEGQPLPEGQAPDASGGQAADGQQPAPEPEMLPVEGGAPILDSAKEQPVQAAPAAPEGQQGEAQQQQAAPQQDPEEVERLRQRIERLEAERGQRPTSDAEAQAIVREFSQPVEFQSVTVEEGQRLQAAPEFNRPDNITIINQTENRYVYEVNNQIIVENNDRDRLARNAQDVYYEELPRGRTREVVVRENGAQIVTIRNRYGDIIQRSRIRPSGEEVVLVYAPEYDTEEVYVYQDPAVYLPPLELNVPVEEYIYDSTRADDYTDYVTFLEQPPVEPVTEIYSVEEVKRSARVRDIMPRVDLDNITFEFGSASIAEDQVRALEEIANGILAILEEDESEIFLLEGHTDAVGTDEANLVLSDQRAESIAIALTNVFGIPAENLQTQGYGERYLKVNTEEQERLNRRVTVRRITPLVQSAQAQQ